MSSKILQKSEKHEVEMAYEKDNDGGVNLYFPKEKIEEIFASFLGDRESLSKVYENNFIVTLDQLRQYHHLLIQKIEKEQFIHLGKISAVARYSDGTKRKVHSYQKLETYHEFRDVETIAFELSWDFILELPGENALQKQKVSIFFNTLDGTEKKGKITVTIEHTNQVWATEVLRMFEEQIKKIVIEPSAIEQTFSFPMTKTLISQGTFWSIIIVFIFIAAASFLKFGVFNPITVDDEFIWDLSQVLEETKENTDIKLVLDYFILKDFFGDAKGIINHLYESKYFHPAYDAVLNKFHSGYYDNGEESERLFFTVEAMRSQNLLKKRLKTASIPIKLIMLTVFINIAILGFYKIYKDRSFLNITDGDAQTLKKYNTYKSKVSQFAYGVSTSLIATAIYIYSFKFIGL